MAGTIGNMADKQNRRPAIIGYGVAVLAVGVALAINWILPPLRVQASSPLFILAVVAASWIGGRGPGLAAALLSALSIDFFLVAPTASFAVGIDDVVRTVVFLIVSFTITWLENSRRRLTDSLQQRADELETAHRNKDQFLAVLAHELRNPLAAASTALQLIRIRGKDVLGLSQTADTAERQIEKITRLIEDLLDVSRMERGKVAISREPIELREVIDRAVETAQPLIDARRHELHLSLADDALPMMGDGMRLEQVFINLLTNAAKYAESGGRIDLTVSETSNEVVVRVRDTGRGIAPEVLPRVFELFAQAENRTDDRHGGLGIGLFLVRSLVEMHGGSVHASSDGLGQGSEFAVHLPLARAVSEMAPQGATQARVN